MKATIWLKAMAWLGILPFFFGSVGLAQGNPAERDLEQKIKKRREKLIEALGGERVARFAQAGKFWLGLKCAPVSPALRSQLNLSAKQGLLVEEVVVESPAAKTGIKRYDVLLEAGDRKISNLEGLVQQVQAAKKSEMTITLIRGGKQMTVQVTPAERPEVDIVLDRDIDTVRKYFENFKSRRGPRDLRLRIARPPLLVELDRSRRIDFSKDLKISVHKQGGKPAKIVVEKDGQKWEVTEDNMDKLPADVRRHVKALLSRTQVPHTEFELDVERGTGPRVRVFRNRVLKSGDDKPETRLEERLEQAVEQIEKLRKSLEEIRKSLPKQKDRDAKDE